MRRGALHVVLLLALALLGWSCFYAPPAANALLTKPQPASDGVTGEEIQRELFERSALSVFASHLRSPRLGQGELDALIDEFASKKREAGDGGVPSSVTPVVIVASLIGSKIQAQLDNYRSTHWYCWTEWREWFTTWMNYDEFIPPFINCWFEQMALHLDSRSGRSFNTPGVSTRLVDYGGVDGLTYLDDAKTVGIWNTTVNLLESLGWQVGKNLRGAPYDWRFGPATFAAEDWPRLRALIEETYTLNNNSKVAAVSLSMGGPYFLGFLNQQSQAWKDKYLHSYSSFDGAFGGSPSATSALISTSGWWASKIFNPEAMRALVQSWPSTVWMLPFAQIYGSNQVWVSTTNPPRNYTTADFASLLALAKGHNASLVYDLLQSEKWFNFDAPGVETHCFFGTGVPTPMHMTFATPAFDTQAVTVNGNGDGVVPEAGLRVLEQWRGKQAQGIFSYPIQGLYHGSSVQNKEVLRMFLEVLSRR